MSLSRNDYTLQVLSWGRAHWKRAQSDTSQTWEPWDRKWNCFAAKHVSKPFMKCCPMLLGMYSPLFWGQRRVSHSEKPFNLFLLFFQKGVWLCTDFSYLYEERLTHCNSLIYRNKLIEGQWKDYPWIPDFLCKQWCCQQVWPEWEGKIEDTGEGQISRGLARSDDRRWTCNSNQGCSYTAYRLNTGAPGEKDCSFVRFRLHELLSSLLLTLLKAEYPIRITWWNKHLIPAALDVIRRLFRCIAQLLDDLVNQISLRDSSVQSKGHSFWLFKDAAIILLPHSSWWNALMPCIGKWKLRGR